MVTRKSRHRSSATYFGFISFNESAFITVGAKLNLFVAMSNEATDTNGNEHSQNSEKDLGLMPDIIFIGWYARMRRDSLQNGCNVQKASSLQEGQKQDTNGYKKLTETSMAIPVQPLLLLFPKNDNAVYETNAPAGVAELNIATCFLQSDRGSEFAISEVVRAKAVGAVIVHIVSGV
jgi:hypothetical protein